MPTLEKSTRAYRKSLEDAKKAAQRLYDEEAGLRQPDSQRLAKLGGRMEGIDVATRLLNLLVDHK